MKLNKILTLSAVCATLLITGCANNEQNITTTKKDIVSDKEIKLQAKQAIIAVGGALKKNMIEKMKAGGPANAAEFCSVSATNLAKEVSKTLPEGVSVKRITDKPRNINNQATQEQSKILKELESNMKQDKKADTLVKQISNNHYQVYKAVQVGGKCTICHGTETKRNQNAYNVIASKYPNDKAIDYKKGDFRGAFLVDIIK
ncbi:MAG: DUF3365 domain-containing protein [Campylobacterota bacterium]|nr:DUF3365 domain-containing protein [Campylobacterota bacterium]